MPIRAIEVILDAYVEGRAAVLITGRSEHDLCTDEDHSRIRPFLEVLRRELRSKHDLALITYSMAGGLDYDPSRYENEADQRTMENALRANDLLNIPPDQNEVIRVIRGVARMSRTPTEGLNWSDGKPLRFVFFLHFGEHLAPGTLTNGTQTDAQLVAIELAHLTAQSLALRSSGNFIIISAREGLVDDLVVRALHHIRLPQPDPDEKTAFIETALSLYNNASFADGLTVQSVVHLTSNTPNRGVEALLRASHRTKGEVTAGDLTTEKARAVQHLSEGTLTLVDGERVRGLDLRGQNIARPREILTKYAEGLAIGDTSIPGSVVLVGPPGTGKTDLAISLAVNAGVAALQIHSPKDQFVGGTERKARLQQALLGEWIPNVGWIDEIDKAMPLGRNDFNSDSGATEAVMASLLTLMSDESRRGKSLIIGTTNDAERIGEAMRSRIRFIAVLHPLLDDFPSIIASTARWINSEYILDESDPKLIEASDIFYYKGANVRHIRSSLNHVLLQYGELGPEQVLVAANDFMACTDFTSVIYADYWAAKLTSFQSDLPWADDPGSYSFPSHFDGIIDPDSGVINQKRLSDRILELRPIANV
ncbi:AAA family ATPase [Gemmatimonadota bacterium]